MKVKLNFTDRIHIIGFLPQTGSEWLVANLVEDFKKELSFTVKEIEDCNIRQEGQAFLWDKQKAKDIEVDINSVIIGQLEEGIIKLNEAKGITGTHIPLIKKLVNVDEFFTKEEKKNK